MRGRQASLVRPLPQLVNGFGGRDGDRDDIASRLAQRDVEQCGQPTARSDFRAGPLFVIGARLVCIQLELPDIEVPDRGLLSI